MGLLDSLFDGSAYSGQGGGLLDFLRNSQMQNSQYQPSPGFPDNQPSPLDNAQFPYGPIGAPSQAMAQMPPPASQPRAQPIAVGNYQMPRIGSDQQFTPDPAALPPNSQPTQGGILPAMPSTDISAQSRQPAMQPTLPQLPGTSILDRIGNPNGLIARLRGTDDHTVALQQQRQTQNLTFKALVAKGVDPQVAMTAVSPGNTEMLKNLIDENFKAKTPMSIGGGYIYDPGTGKTTRAYEPDDKTPAGFAKGDDGNMHFIPGGPADPAYIQLSEAKKKDPNGVFTLGRGGELYKLDKDGNPVIVHKNEAAQESTLDEGTTKAMAAQYLAGDKSVMTNLGRGAQGAANIVQLRTEIYKQAEAAGLNGKDIVNNFNEQAGNLAGQRSIGTRAANISLAANEANNMIPIALKASESVPRGEWMPWNKMVQAYQTGSSSPELARFVAATNSLVNSYVRAVSPSGVPTDSMREHAYSMLNSAQSAKAYKAVTDIMQDEMKAAMEAPGQVRKELRHDDKPTEAQPATIGKTKNGVSWGIVQ
jgi:hypothetical protein